MFKSVTRAQWLVFKTVVQVTLLSSLALYLLVDVRVFDTVVV